MVTARTPGGGVHEVERGLALIAEGVAAVLSTRPWSLSQVEVRDALGAAEELARSLDAVRLHLVRACVARDDGSVPGRETRQWLQSQLRMTAGQARSLVEGARLADPDDGMLRGLGRALAAGQTTLGHLDQARRAVDKIPARALAQHRQAIDETLTNAATSLNGHQMGTVCQHLVGALAPASEDHLDPHLRERRFCDYTLSRAGVLRGSFLLEGLDAATAKAVLDHFAAPGHHVNGTEPLPGITDDRTPAQRRADALASVFRIAQAADTAGTRGGEPAHLLIVTTVDQLAAAHAGNPGLASCQQTGAVSPGLLQRAACDAVLHTVVLDRHGAVVELHSPQRLATRAQRRALTARDRGCAWPGCDVPAAGCDAHHIVWWSRGGTTELGNLVLLCPRHHTEIHCETWRVEMREGVPWFIPPPWIDPDGTPLRNNVHDHIDQAHRLARQLAIDDPPPGPDHDTGPDPPR